ncbi:nucleoside hydrolase [Bacteroidia bacterium]|nr:nucleoside hydrolase [Bacteroidia bacterium]
MKTNLVPTFILTMFAIFSIFSCKQATEGTCAQVSIIFDSDLSPDYDDVGALTLLHALADSGEAKIVGTIASNRYYLAGPCIDVINTYYGRGDLPIGAPLAGANEADGHQIKWTESLVANYPHKLQSTTDAEDAVKVYRRLLAAAADNSIVIVTVGFLTNMRDLLKSPADELSPLDGKQLIAKKVHHLVSMVGAFPEGREYNLYIDAKASDFIAKEWPTRILFLGGEIGCKLLTGKRLIASNIAHTPAKDVFTICLAQDNPEGRCSWDQATTLIAVRGTDRYFNTVKGHIVVNENGSNTWINDPNGTQEYVTEKMPWPELTKVIEDLMMHEAREK